MAVEFESYPPLGAYEPLALLGRGGMAEVFHVRHKLIGAEFALKRMRTELVEEPQLRALFAEELKALVTLRHPNVVEVHDVFTAEDGAPVIVMELLVAPTLRERSEERPLSLREILALAHAVASGLSHAHRAGIVHCDLKPDNVLLCEGDASRAKIIDFGIAHLSKKRSRSTRVGTVPYMAPEQLEDKDVDARTDVFAFGVMLFEAMEGRLPVDEDKVEDTLKAWRAQRFTFTKDAPRELRELCAQCLAFKAADRPQDADSLLQRVRYIESMQTTFIDSSWNRAVRPSPSPVLVGACILALGGAVALFWLTRHGDDVPPVQSHTADVLSDPALVPLTHAHRPPRERRTSKRVPARKPVQQRLDETEDLSGPEE